MQKEIQTFLRVKPDWKVAGEWIVAEGANKNTNLDIPAFLIWAGHAYESLSKQGVGSELPASMVTWLKDQMNKVDHAQEHGYVHPAFSKIFPITNLPETVVPNWEPWKVIETSSPDSQVVVQPLTLTQIATPKVMNANLVSSNVYIPPRIDPFLMANVTSDNSEISRAESSRIKLIISSFWQNISVSQAAMDEISRMPKNMPSREAAKKAQEVMSSASQNLWSLIEQVSLYSRSLDLATNGFPLSPTSRGVIMLPWIIKAAESWMQPISILASMGKIELPTG